MKKRFFAFILIFALSVVALFPVVNGAVSASAYSSDDFKDIAKDEFDRIELNRAAIYDITSDGLTVHYFCSGVYGSSSNRYTVNLLRSDEFFDNIPTGTIIYYNLRGFANNGFVGDIFLRSYPIYTCGSAPSVPFSFNFGHTSYVFDFHFVGSFEFVQNKHDGVYYLNNIASLLELDFYYFTSVGQVLGVSNSLLSAYIDNSDTLLSVFYDNGSFTVLGIILLSLLGFCLFFAVFYIVKKIINRGY